MNLKTTFAFNVAIAILCGWRADAQIYDTNNVVVQTLAGSDFNGYLDGQGQLTMWSCPSQIVADSAGNLFVWDSGNSRIRKIDTNANVTTFAGGGASQLPAIGTNANLSTYNIQGAMIMDKSNIICCSADISGGTPYFFKIKPDGSINQSTLTNMVVGSGLCFDSIGNLYFTGGNKIYRALTNGAQEVFVGSGNTGGIDGNGIFTSFSSPTKLACDAADNIYVWDAATRIRRINQNRDVTTIVTSGTTADGPNPHFSGVNSMFFVGGDLIVGNGTCLRRLTVTTNATTIAGSFTGSGYTNGIGSAARFSAGGGFCTVGFCYFGGSYFVADSGNRRVRQISFNPSVQVVTGANLGIGTFAGVTITGAIGRTYQVQSSPDTSNWTTRATLVLNSNPYLWIDQNPVDGNNFYRALLLP